MILKHCLYAAALLPLLAQAQQLSGPMSGFVYDPQVSAVRPIMGVPGSAYLGRPVARGVAAASIAPDARFAVIFAGGRAQLLRNLTFAGAEAMDLEGAGTFDLSAWSGDSVVLYSKSGRSFQRIDNLGGEPRVSAPNPVEFTPFALVSAPEGREIVAVSGTEVYRVSSGGAAELAWSAPEAVSAVAVARSGRMFIGSGTTIWEMAGGSAAPFTTEQALGESAAALAVSPDGKQLLVLLPSQKQLQVYDTYTHTQIASIPAGDGAGELRPLPGGAGYLLNVRRPGQPLAALAGAPPAVFFIPAQDEE